MLVFSQRGSFIANWEHAQADSLSGVHFVEVCRDTVHTQQKSARHLLIALNKT